MKAALGGDNQVEFTDGGFSGTGVINPETNKLDVTLTDRTAWDLADAERERMRRAGGIGNAVRLFMDKYGSSGEDNIGDYTQKL